MKIQISLIALLSVATVSALSLEGFKCGDHVILTGDPAAPIRTVQICGVKDYAGVTSYIDYKTASEIGQPSAVRNSYVKSLNQARPLSSSSSSQLKSNENQQQQLASAIRQSLPILKRFYETSKYASSKDSSSLIEKYQSLQNKLNAIAEEASQTKRSVEELATLVKNIFDILLVQNVNTKKEGNVEMNLNLGPTHEDLLRKFLQLPAIDAHTEQPVNVHTTVSTKVSNKSNSEENNTEERDSTEETTEDYDSWIRLHFGPATTPRAVATKKDSDEYSYDGSSEERLQQ
ncbi:uncharacterized protein LOC128922671 [Zeugodacus cucurbitae]|uniref:uncharacterized protein LOC128922671 n=1 Tax=Zeugodacus cucurbitae TaxID=28588 RepID=UPI0023D91FAD|nr:uncharacterized protein LOC128922671 [Zeugodacus cucurbitae]